MELGLKPRSDEISSRSQNATAAESHIGTSGLSTQSQTCEDYTSKSTISGTGKLEENGVTYSWRDLNVYATTKNFWGKGTQTHILKGVSGICQKGELLAILGASGAGKTTLLNVLTYRSSQLKIVGDMRLNGSKVNPDTLMGISAYVQQVDLFSRVFTVREQLAFQAQLRIGKEISEAERNQRIDQVIKDLGLAKCANSLIGEPGRIKGISGGEKKRLAFACELITNPMLLLCDEPTSGIDSFMSLSVLNAMKDLTKSGKTVISTIHQPSSEIFHMFDHLMFLADGRVAFSGTREEAYNFFNRLNKPCPANFNPADHYIHTLAVRSGSEVEKQDRIFVNSVCDRFAKVEGVKLKQTIERNSDPNDTRINSRKLTKSPYRATYLNQFKALMRRCIYDVVRDPFVTVFKFSQMIFFAVMFGLIYYKQEITSYVVVGNITGFLFILVTNLSFSLLFPTLTLFSADLPLFLREHWNGLYRSDVYFLTRNLVEFPSYLLLPITFVSISYYMVGLRPEANYFLKTLLITILVANTAVSYGYMISCLAKDYNTAIILSTPLTLPLMFFGGFYVNNDSVPMAPIGWMKYLSWFMYGFESASVNQWDGLTAKINGVEVNVGKYQLNLLGFEPSDFTKDLWCLFGLAVSFRILAYIFLLIQTIRKP